MSAITSKLSPLIVSLRIATATLGGYAFTWGYTTLSIVGLSALGMAYDQAYIATMMLAFVIYLAVFLWSFVTVNLARVAAILFGSGAIMTTLAWWLQRSLVG